ncbi:MAG: GNAT family N-acetyltransferase [Bacteroidota bacterium]
MLKTAVPVFHNLIEPAGLLRCFQECPPEGFSTLDLEGVPAFSTPFDLLTTVQPSLRRKLEALPFAARWRRLLRPNTCFVGTTVTEYALLPESLSPEILVRRLLDRLAPRYPFLIIKDIPSDAALVGDAACAYSRRLTEACKDAGFVLVDGQALAYVPVDFASTDEYLARLSRARRKDLRRKLKSKAKLQIEAIPTGDRRFQDENLLAELYALYLNVYRQSEIHFDLLSATFFKTLLQDADSGGVVFAYSAEGKLIGYNLCFIANNRLLDKYVGFLYPQARDYNLYAVSWFHNLDYALTHGLQCYVAGWTDPEIKRYLGARFTLTRHAVYVRNPLLRGILAPFKRFFETDQQWHASHVAGADS